MRGEEEGGGSEVHAAVHAGKLPSKNVSLPLWGPVSGVDFFFSKVKWKVESQ